MKWKKTIQLISFLSLPLFLLTIMPAYGQQDKPVTLRYAEMASPKGTRQDALKWWASEIEKRTKGMVKFQFFWSDALLKAADCLEGIGRGTAEVGTAWGIYHPAKTPLWTVGDPPFSHTDTYAGLKAMHELFKTYDPMQNELQKWNVRFLAPFVTDMSQVGAKKKAIIVPEDAKGLKIRFAGGEWAKLWQDCGAVPLKLTYGEVYEALMRGTADASQTYVWTLEGYKLWDVIKHFTIIEGGQICSYGIVINLDVWKGFSPETRRIFMEVSDAYVEQYGRALVEDRARVTKLAEEKGVKFYKPTKEQLSLWLEKAKPYMEAWVKDMSAKGVPAKETQERFLHLTQSIEKEIHEKGYPWKR